MNMIALMNSKKCLDKNVFERGNRSKMSNINDYLLWRGDIPINKDYPFNEIDALILGRFSYLIFNKIKMNVEETIESISKKMSKFENDEFLFDGDKELITYLGESIRFKKMIVSDFVENTDKELEKAFSAITIHNAYDEMYISYTGTDASLVSWKEDFNLMFLENIPCQIHGSQYLREIAKKYPSKKIRLGGHSKGGNIAVYSFVTSTKKIQNRVIKVYNYDGPGFNKDFLKNFNSKEMLQKIETYIPQGSIVGKLLNHKEKITIVQSVGNGVLQHDVFTWQVLKDDLVRLKKTTDASIDLDKAISKWFEDTTNDQRKIVVNTIFDLFASTQSETLDEMYENMAKNLPIMLKGYNKVSKEDKEMISKAIKTLIKNYWDIRSNREKKKLRANIRGRRLRKKKNNIIIS